MQHIAPIASKVVREPGRFDDRSKEEKVAAQLAMDERWHVPVKVTRKFYGLSDNEAEYSLRSWKSHHFDWATEATKIATDFILGVTGNLWIYSAKPGTGKTGFAIGLGRKMLAKDSDVAIIRIPEFASVYGTDAKREYLFNQAACRTCILDDFHRQPTNNYSLDVMHNFIDHGHRQGTRFIVTANISINDFIKGFGEETRAMLDRLNNGGLTQVEAKGDSGRI